MSFDKRTILVVEDNEDDWFILQRAIKVANILNPVRHVPDGQQAIDYLQGAGPFSDRTAFPSPSLVLLDLKLPVKQGFEVLSWARQNPLLKGMVIVILTSSKAESDIAKAYALGANAFLVKPTAADKLADAMKAMDIFWFRHNQFQYLD